MANLADMPASAMATTPALAPPKGVESNFDNPFDQGPYDAWVVYFLLILGFVLYLNRLYVKFYVLKKPNWDDLTCTIGLVFATITSGGYLWLTTVGPVGIHQYDIPISRLAEHSYTVGTWLNNVFAPIAEMFIKLTLFLIYWQIFWVLKWIRIVIYIGAGFTVLFYTSTCLALLILATPWPGQTWFEHSMSAMMWKADTVLVVQSIGGVLINLTLLALPIRAILKLQIPVARKVRIGILCTIGLVACSCSIASVQYRIKQLQSTDKTWETLIVDNMVAGEMLIGLMIANMPQFSSSMARLFAPGVDRMKSYLSSVRSASKSSNREDSVDTSVVSPHMSSAPNEIGEKKTVHVFVEERRESESDSDKISLAV